MQFVTILEYNHKEHEATLHYCQWDGNEAGLESLFRVIDASNGDYGDSIEGDVSTFEFSRELIPEAAVDVHIKLPYGCFTKMFKKHVGTFKCPLTVEDALDRAMNNRDRGYMSNAYACGLALDEYFYASKLGNYFK